jgi:hypothetical protein
MMTQVAYFSLFEDAISAASLAAATGTHVERVNEFLSAACAAAIRVFELRGTTTSKVTSLETGEEDSFVDDTAANAWTFVQGVYAGLAAHDREAARELAFTGGDLSTPDRLIIEPIVTHYAKALQASVLGDNRVARQEILRVLMAASDESRPDVKFWTVQTLALRAILDGDEESFEKLISGIKEEWRIYFAPEGERARPECALVLPVLGLGMLLAPSKSPM